MGQEARRSLWRSQTLSPDAQNSATQVPFEKTGFQDHGGLLKFKLMKNDQVLCGHVLSIRDDETISFQTSLRTLKPDIGSCSHAPKALEKEIEFDLAL